MVVFAVVMYLLLDVTDVDNAGNVARCPPIRVVQNVMKMLFFGFLKSEPNSNFENRKAGFHGSVKKTESSFLDGF